MNAQILVDPRDQRAMVDAVTADLVDVSLQIVCQEQIFFDSDDVAHMEIF